jgi:hypothetical protein
MTIVSALCALCGVALGVGAFVGTQVVTKDMFAPIVDACVGGAGAAKASGLHAYEPLLGGPFVCIITQFLLALVQQPAGLLAWGVIAGIALPASVLMITEAGRGGASGPVKFPTPILVLGQILGISVVFPAAWLPAYAVGGGGGAVSTARAKAACVLSLPFAALTVALFVLDTTSYAWTVTAGVLGGPLVALGPLLLWSLAPPYPTDEAVAAGADALRRSYATVGAVAMLGWAVNVWLACRTFDSADSVWAALWSRAPPAVAFMTIDAGVLYLGVLLAVLVGGDGGVAGVATALALTPVLGPGGACAFVLAKREGRRAVAARSPFSETPRSPAKPKSPAKKKSL